MALERFANTPTPAAPSTPWTTLNGAITSGALSLTVTSASAFPSLAQFRVLIDSEWILITAGAGTTTWTVTRGAEGSTPTAHAHGASIFHVLTAAALARNPRSMTTLGDMEYMAADLGPARLAAPSDGDYVTRWTSGVPSWIVAGGGGTPGGSDTQIQYNDGGAFGGSADLTWDQADKKLTTSKIYLSHTFSDDPADYFIFGADAVYASAAGRAGLSAVGMTLSIEAGAGELTNYTAPFGFAFYNSSSNPISDVRGNDLYIDNLAGGTITIVAAAAGQIYNEAGGTLGDVSVFRTGASPYRPGNFGAGHITKWAGFHAIAPNVSGTYGAVYGLQIDDQSDLSPSGNNHAINYADLFVVAADGIAKAAGYKSSDGSAGITGGPFTSVTVKNGLVVAGS